MRNSNPTCFSSFWRVLASIRCDLGELFLGSREVGTRHQRERVSSQVAIRRTVIWRLFATIRCGLGELFLGSLGRAIVRPERELR